MSRPAQLEQQLARVKEIQAEMAEGETPENVETPPAEVPPEPVTPAEVIESPATISKDEYNKLEQRYRTLQGMHTADTSRYRGELSTAMQAIQDLEDRVAAAERSAVPAYTPAKYITKEDEDEYGDTLEMVRRAAREEAENTAGKREQALLDRIAQLEKQFGHVQNTVLPKVEDLSQAQVDQVKAAFWGAINTQVPDWRAINDNEGFKAWLLAEDPITGANRQQFLSQARNQYDATRVIRFFEEWKRTQAGGQTPAPKNSANSELDRLVAPGASKGGTSTQPEKKQWTGALVSAFYKDIHLGKYADRADERKKIEADIFQAQAEGRYTP